MFRSILAVLAGAVAWPAVFLPANALVTAAAPGSFRPDGTTDHAALLGVLILTSLLASVVAGFVTATLAFGAEKKHSLALGILQLATGIFVQSQYWTVLPLWYHLVFLGLLVPAILAGGKLGADRKARAAFV